MKEPIIVKFEPWKGLENEVYKGTKTKITLYEDRLEYKIKFNQRITVSLIQTEEIKDVDNFIDELGVIEKTAIIAFTAYIDTEYAKKNAEPTKVYMLDLSYGGLVLSLSFETEENQKELYNTIHNWKYGNN